MREINKKKKSSTHFVSLICTVLSTTNEIITFVFSYVGIVFSYVGIVFSYERAGMLAVVLLLCSIKYRKTKISTLGLQLFSIENRLTGTFFRDAAHIYYLK